MNCNDEAMTKVDLVGQEIGRPNRDYGATRILGVAILLTRDKSCGLWKVWLARYLQAITVPWNGVDGTRV